MAKSKIQKKLEKSMAMFINKVMGSGLAQEENTAAGGDDAHDGDALHAHHGDDAHVRHHHHRLRPLRGGVLPPESRLQK